LVLLLQLTRREKILDVAMTFKHIDNLHGLTFATKEDDVALVWKASDVRQQLRPDTPWRSGQGRKISALRLDPVDESPANGTTSAFQGYVPKNVAKILARRRQIDQPTQSVTFP
jgi:hypothetical protein